MVSVVVLCFLYGYYEVSFGLGMLSVLLFLQKILLFWGVSLKLSFASVGEFVLLF